MWREVTTGSVCVSAVFLFANLKVKAEESTFVPLRLDENFRIPDPIFFLLYPKGFSLTIAGAPWLLGMQVFCSVDKSNHTFIAAEKDTQAIQGSVWHRMSYIPKLFWEILNRNATVQDRDWFFAWVFVTAFDGSHYTVVNASHIIEVFE